MPHGFDALIESEAERDAPRRADRVDVSGGIVRFGVARTWLRPQKTLPSWPASQYHLRPAQVGR